MKKIVLSAILALSMGGVATAQTNFRSLDFKEAVKVAQQEKKLLFVDFYTDWCGPCKKMTKTVFPDKKVGDFMNKHFVSIKLNAEKEGKELAKLYQVQAYPTFIAVNDKEEIVFTVKGAYEPQEFIDKVSGSMDPDMTPARMQARYEGGERTPKLVNEYALTKMMAGNETEGFKIVNSYYDSLSDAQRLLLENSFLFTRYTLDLNDYKASFMVDHRNEFDPAVKDQIVKRVKQMYTSKVTGYLSGYLTMEKKFVEADYQALKKEIADKGIDQKNEYAGAYMMIESRVKEDDATYFKTIQREFDALSSHDRDIILMNLPRLIPTKDKAILKEMSQFIRARLSTLDGNIISMAGRLLTVIEKDL